MFNKKNTPSIVKIPALDAVLHEESWDWLQQQNLRLAEAIAQASQQHTPKEIYFSVLREVGDGREALARRCMNAAIYLKSQES